MYGEVGVCECHDVGEWEYVNYWLTVREGGRICEYLDDRRSEIRLSE